MQTKPKYFDKYSEYYEKMSICYPEWLFGRLIAANWSWSSAMRLVMRKLGVRVDIQALHDEFSGDKDACGHALWEKHLPECKRIWDEVHNKTGNL